MILVTGATGQVGYHLMEALADATADVTAMVRVEAKAAGLPGTPRHLVATFDDPPAAETLRRFDRIFLLSPAHEAQVELEMIFIDAILAAGRRPHIVKVAADGFQEPDCDVRFMRNHREVAVHLNGTGLPVTYLAPNMYMENLLEAADTIRDQGMIFAPAGSGKIGFIAARDVADVAAHVLTSNGHEDQTYVLTGSHALGYAEVAARISAVSGREVGYTDLPEPDARAQLQASGLSPWQVEGTLELFDWIRCGGTDSVTAAVGELTGHDPQVIEDWLAESRSAFVGRPPGLPPSVV